MNGKNFLGFLFLASAACSTTRTASTEPEVSPTTPSNGAAEAVAASQPPKLRVDRSARPIPYALDLTVVPSEDEFNGSIEIEIELSKPNDLIWLNATELQIRSATWRSGKDSIGGHSVPGNSDFIGIALDRPAPAGP